MGAGMYVVGWALRHFTKATPSERPRRFYWRPRFIRWTRPPGFGLTRWHTLHWLWWHWRVWP